MEKVQQSSHNLPSFNLQWFILIVIPLLLDGCTASAQYDSVDQYKQEIMDTELAFSDMAGEKGIEEAFLNFAAEDAVIMRSDSLISGRREIARFFGDQRVPLKDELLVWKPDFVDVAASGELGYTYGSYTFSYTDSSGERIESKGIFHTVWKKQSDGSWKFVWD